MMLQCGFGNPDCTLYTGQLCVSMQVAGAAWKSLHATTSATTRKLLGDLPFWWEQILQICGPPSAQ